MSDFTTKTDISDPVFYQERADVKPITLVDEYSDTVFYVGVSKNGSDIAKPVWQIRKIWKNGRVWHTGEYPNGNRNFIYVWGNRLSYTYT